MLFELVKRHDRFVLLLNGHGQMLECIHWRRLSVCVCCAGQRNGPYVQTVKAHEYEIGCNAWQCDVNDFVHTHTIGWIRAHRVCTNTDSNMDVVQNGSRFEAYAHTATLSICNYLYHGFGFWGMPKSMHNSYVINRWSAISVIYTYLYVLVICVCAVMLHQKQPVMPYTTVAQYSVRPYGCTMMR